MYTVTLALLEALWTAHPKEQADFCHRHGWQIHNVADPGLQLVCVVD
jgi:hypothetical protein